MCIECAGELVRSAKMCDKSNKIHVQSASNVSVFSYARVQIYFLLEVTMALRAVEHPSQWAPNNKHHRHFVVRIMCYSTKLFILKQRLLS